MKAFDLSGKTALVTGCKRGIGFAMAEGLAEAGADIIGVSATLEAQGSAIATAVNALGRRFAAYQCDFSQRAAVKAFAASSLRSVPNSTAPQRRSSAGSSGVRARARSNSATAPTASPS